MAVSPMNSEQQQEFVNAILMQAKEKINSLIVDGTLNSFGEKELRRFIHELIASDFDYAHWWDGDDLAAYRRVIIDNELFSHNFADGYIVVWTQLDRQLYGRDRYIDDVKLFHDYDEQGVSAADRAYSFMEHLKTQHGPHGDGSLYTAHLCYILDSTEKELLATYELSNPDQ